MASGSAHVQCRRSIPRPVGDQPNSGVSERIIAFFDDFENDIA
jgi:hypothetical protein